jgi:uncharacterized membrane protein
MELTLLHPKIVHLPIALAVIIPLLVLAIWVVRSSGGFPKQVWWIVFGLQIMLAGSSFAAMETGEIDEDRAEQVVPESAIEKHEEAAEVFSWATLVGLPFLLGLGLFERRSVAHGLSAATLVVSIVVLVLGYQVGAAGGAIVYEHGLSKLSNTPVLTQANGHEDWEAD